MFKNKAVILLIIIILFLIGSVVWVLVQKSKFLPSQEVEQNGGEAFSLTVVVQSVDAENGFLMVKQLKEDRVLKVIVSETTSLIRLEYPFDLENIPQEGGFTLKQTEIKISDFKADDNVFIKSKENIAGKTEIDRIDYVQILP